MPTPAAAGDEAGQPPSAQDPPVSPRLTDDNVDQLTRVLPAECQRTCNADEIQGVGSTVINRMNRNGTDKVIDVISGKYAIAGKANPHMVDIARQLLSGQLGDNTGGATHFYSPRSMPTVGDDPGNNDISGGPEQIGNHPANWMPRFATAYPQNAVSNARDWVVKFYTQPGNGRVY